MTPAGCFLLGEGDIAHKFNRLSGKSMEAELAEGQHKAVGLVVVSDHNPPHLLSSEAFPLSALYWYLGEGPYWFSPLWLSSTLKYKIAPMTINNSKITI